MALILSEAAKLSLDVMQVGVIETVVKESPVLQVLPFDDIVGNSLLYNRENVAPTAAFFAVGGTWSEGVTTFTQVTAGLKILGGDADVDNYIRQTRQNVQDIEASVLALKAKAVAHTFEDTFIYGDDSVDTNSFDGLHISIPSAQRVAQGSGSTVAALSLAKLDQAIDLVKPGRPELLLCSRRTRRLLATYARSLSGTVMYRPDEFGRGVMWYNDIPVVISDFILDTETIASGTYSAKTGSTGSSIFILSFGFGKLMGIQNGGIQIERIGSLETKDATRHRIKWYVNGVVLQSTLAVAVVDGISSGAVVA